MVWLVEPFRLGRAEKWSGTNQHPNHSRNKLGNILNAFAHFVYDASYKPIALADIQTTKARIGNTVSQVLFDLTTHTNSASQCTNLLPIDSGVGDHGQDDIDAFVEQHVCTARCESLGLVPVGENDNEHEEDDDE
ncbi:kinase-like domain-containing protein [Mycena sanguinolenta]|nr:kinase-like domain-containing protein [Mycena sanguinolenta]